MRKIFLCLLLVLGFNQVRSQYLLGLDEEGVKQEAKTLGQNTNLQFTKQEKEGKYSSLSWYDDQIECRVQVMFNPFSGLSVITTLLPNDTVVLNALIEGFKEQNFEKKEKYWIMRVASKIVKIELVEYKGKGRLVFREIAPTEEY